MNVFDLIFIIGFLSAVIYAIRIAWLLATRRWPAARRQAKRLGAALALYGLIVIAVGLASPRRVLSAKTVLRYDDWCLSVDKTARSAFIEPDVRAQPDHQFLIVTLKITNAARRVRQAAPAGALVYLVDENNRRYEVSERGQAALERAQSPQPALTTPIDAGDSFATTRVFEVPSDANGLALGHRHGSGSRFPGLFIIGEGFRGPKLLRL